MPPFPRFQFSKERSSQARCFCAHVRSEDGVWVRIGNESTCPQHGAVEVSKTKVVLEKAKILGTTVAGATAGFFVGGPVGALFGGALGAAIGRSK